MNLDCSHKTFSEKHPFVAAKSKKTNRLIQNILYTSSQLSSLNASKLLKSENISVCKSSIPELQTFINGIKKDITAVKNGIIYSYNNGLAEGSVNKIKVIKRVMYGRNSFELLKAKVLFGELFHVKFN